MGPIINRLKEVKHNAFNCVKIPLPPETSRKKVALHALWPTFGGLLMIGAAGCMYYGALFLGKDWFS